MLNDKGIVLTLSIMFFGFGFLFGVFIGWYGMTEYISNYTDECLTKLRTCVDAYNSQAWLSNLNYYGVEPNFSMNYTTEGFE